MACVDQLHINDVGTSLEFLIKECEPDGAPIIVDLTDATALSVKLQKPDGITSLTKTATVFTGGTNGDGTDGIAQYVTETGVIDTAGKWKAQVTATFPNGGVFHSSIVTIKVLDNL